MVLGRPAVLQLAQARGRRAHRLQQAVLVLRLFHDVRRLQDLRCARAAVAAPPARIATFAANRPAGTALAAARATLAAGAPHPTAISPAALGSAAAPAAPAAPAAADQPASASTGAG